ncbi:LysR family transcriptional regulator [Aliiroseovarius sp. KMU-50]|uniref:LysR family transcriptional regulator n=1 Tax=Aliiroseovarius salicola TaxID=3009082 RepID=A0ABT4VX97_9RHOB|nr:LysR family transcriptional regulator [Aliiroseovarius sp. KMU-50]MDA5092885.1 LysR family transcriptional regulator [Aliiroseovarius sp. KMU-50]
MDMLKAMRVIAEISYHGSFAQAARAMNLSAPSITRIVAELEADLGVRLFNRSTRSLALTPEGENFLRRSEVVLQEIEALRDVTKEQHTNPSGKLVVTSAVTFGNEMLAPILPEFLRRYPQVSIDLRLGNRPVDLIEEHVDVALRVGSGPLPDSSLTAIRVCGFRMIFVATPSHIERYGFPGVLDDLVGRPIVKLAIGSWGHVQRLTAPEGEIDYSIPNQYVVDSYRAQIWGVLNSDSCALMHDYVAKQELEAGRLVRLLPDCQTVEQDIYALYAHRTLMSARIRVFIDFLKEVMA